MSDSVRADRDAGETMFEEAARVSIAQLDPNTANIEDHHIHATVALIWPYSSSTRQLSLLLAEKDIRLRKSKGQVKVIFHGGCAREVAQTKIGIGDHVRLSLRDVAWTRTGEEVSTPGKKVDWDIDISKSVKLEHNSHGNATLTVNYVANSPSPERSYDPTVSAGSSAVNGLIKIQATHALGPYFSPAGHVSRRSTIGPFVDASLDPFADDDGFVVGKGRKKTKFTRHSGSWQLLGDDDNTFETSEGDQMLSSPSSAPFKIPSQFQSHSEEYNVLDTQEQKTPEAVDEATRDHEDTSSVRSPSELVTVAHPDDSVEQSREVADTIHDTATANQFTQPLPAPMGPPPTPSPTFERHHPETKMPNSTTLTMTPTPVLRPLLSPGLALVSPLIERSGISAGYFPMVSYDESELDTIGSNHDEFVPLTSATEFNGREVNDAFTEQLRGRVDTDISGVSNPSFVTALNDGNRLIAEIGNDGQRHPPALRDAAFINAPLTSTSDDFVITPTISEFVDLDALQQHIDESAMEAQIMEPEDQREDEDMYGPPVEQSSDLIPPTVGLLEDDMTTESDAQPTVVSPTNVKPTSYSYGTEVEDSLLEETHGAKEPSTQQLPSRLEDSPVIEDGEPEDVVYADTGTDKQPIEVFVPQDVSEESGVTLQPSFEQLRDMPQRINAPSGSDGTTEPLQDEVDRARARKAMDSDSPPESPLEVVDLLSSSSESASPESLASDSHVSEPEAAEGDTEPGKELVYHILYSNGEGEKNGVGDGDVRQDGISADSLIQHHIITPDATQTDAFPQESKTPPRVDTKVLLPPTPILTQDKTKSVLVPSPPALQTTTTSQETSLTPAPNLQIEESQSIRRATQRLSRRILPSQIITNEYFTPRRSVRISQASPSPTIATSPTAQQISSPTRPRTRSRRSLSMVAPEEGESLIVGESMQPPTPARGISTRLSYFPHLSTLSQYFNLEVDVIGICSSDPIPTQRAKSGPKDFHTILFLTDASLAKDSVPIRAQIFRPRKNALPTARRGDVVLLRSMKAQTLDHKIMLLSTDTSAWAVFKSMTDRDLDVVIEGPPVEYEQAEKDAADRLMKWWHSDGEKQYPDNQETSRSIAAHEATSPSQRITRSQKRKTNATDHTDGMRDSQIQDGQASPIESTEDVDAPPFIMSSPTQSSIDRTSPTTPVTRSNHRRASSRRSESVVHELRDGTRYTTEEDGRGVSVLHELRDGTFYIDD